MKTWLVLSGSGMRLYVFLGALKALVEAGYRFTGVTGTSGGAIVAGLLGKHWNPADPAAAVDRMIAAAKEIHPASLLLGSIRWRIWNWLLTRLFKRGPKGVFQTNKLLAAFRKHLPATLGKAALPVHITAFQVNLPSPRPVLFTDEATDLPLAVLGSMSLPPPLFDPTYYGNALLQDGGWARNLPIPDDQPHVTALCFADVRPTLNSAPEERTAYLEEVKDNVSLWLKIVFGVIDTNMRDAVAEAEEEGVELKKVVLRTTLESFDFFANKQKIEKAISEGYLSAKDSLSITKIKKKNEKA